MCHPVCLPVPHVTLLLAINQSSYIMPGILDRWHKHHEGKIEYPVNNLCKPLHMHVWYDIASY